MFQMPRSESQRLKSSCRKPDEVDDVVVMRDFDLPRVDVGDELLHCTRSYAKLSLRINPDLGVVALVEMASPELKTIKTVKSLELIQR